MTYKYVTFKIDSIKEYKNLQKLVKLAGKEILIPQIKDCWSLSSKKEITNEVRKLHKGNKGRFNRIKRNYEKIWKSIGGQYIKIIEEILDFKIRDTKYCYIVLSLWVNVADVLGRKNIFIVSAEKQQNPLDFIMLHELTHLYYTDTLTKLRFAAGMKSPLMEGIDHLILFKSPIKKLIKGMKYEKIEFVKGNKEFMKELEKNWKKRKNFKTFLEKAIKIQSKYLEVITW